MILVVQQKIAKMRKPLKIIHSNRNGFASDLPSLGTPSILVLVPIIYRRQIFFIVRGKYISNMSYFGNILLYNKFFCCTKRSHSEHDI